MVLEYVDAIDISTQYVDKNGKGRHIRYLAEGIWQQPEALEELGGGQLAAAGVIGPSGDSLKRR